MTAPAVSPQVTVVVVPRERFSMARRSLASVFENTSTPFKLVYVDAGSPPDLREFLESQADGRQFTLVHSARFLSPNEARNLGFARVDTPYVVFLDNDVVVAPNWLDGLVRCAEETGAWAVGPLYCIGSPYHQKIHMAAGLAHFEESSGARRYIDRHLMAHCWLSDVREQLARQPSERAEFHCMLVRSAALRQLGPLDEKLLGAVETHADLCLRIRAAGGGVWFEPSSVVTYVPPPPLRRSDVPYFLLRWSNEWVARGKARFAEKWGLRADDPYLTRHNWWVSSHRFTFAPWAWTALGVLGMERRNRVAATIWRTVDAVVTRVIAGKHTPHGSQAAGRLQSMH